MEIEIVVYKESGKWYTSEIVKIKENIPLWSDDFKQFIRDNNPANIGNGFIATRTVGEGFHNFLWRYEDVY